MARIKINNAFKNIPSMNGIILTCELLEDAIKIGDKIIINQTHYLLISEVEYLNSENNKTKIALTIYSNNINAIPGLQIYELIGNEFAVY